MWGYLIKNKDDQNGANMGYKLYRNKNTIRKWEKADLDARLFVVGGLEREQSRTDDHSTINYV